MSRFCRLLAVLLAACARQALPITASQLAERSTGRTLLAYLGQRDASVAVCDLNARGPHLAAIDATVRGELMEGLREGRLAPTLWSQCVEHLVRSADPESAALLLDAVAYSYGQVVIDTRVEQDLVMRQQLSALQALLVEDSGDAWPHSHSAANLLADLHDAIARKRLGAVAQRSATTLTGDLELTNGLRGGQPVDVAVLDDLLRAKDESTLARVALHLPDSSLRSEARRRVIRLHIEQSPLSAVRDHAAAVEDALMRLGVNPIAMAEHRPLRGTLDDSLNTRRVVVRQDLEHQTTALVGTVDNEKGVSVLPQLSLRAALHIELEGIDGQVSLCGPPEALNPDPCVPESAVALGNRLAYLERDGTIRFLERLPAREALTLATAGDDVVVPIAVSGNRVTELAFGLRFETPNDLVFGGGSGPELRVGLEPLAGGRLSYTITRGDRQYVAIVERDHANGFHVISQGADGQRGRDGSSGSDGLAGASGSSASCPSSQGGAGGRGDDGGPGEDGGAGTEGGNGGDAVVDIATLGAAADELVALVRKTVLSRGGAGGSGGSGGRGGRGGAGGPGGPGTTCVDADGNTTFLSAGMQGFSGTDGRSGFDGPSGSNGQPGRVTLHVVERR